MSVYTTEELLAWIRERNENIHVSIRKTDIGHCAPWYYDHAKGEIRNYDRSFFQIVGLREYVDGKLTLEQPIILQEEIGYLGIICRRIGDEMHYLMQAKIEPGNINKIQISPTIQATKSNFTQRHGGNRPAFLEYFINAAKYRVVADQIQSEQSSRFLKKRNRNIIVEVNEEIDVPQSHRWMTIDQIKALMCYDNLVNMDTRTTLSCLPLGEEEYLSQMRDESLRRSIEGGGRNLMPQIYKSLNDFKMFRERRLEAVPLHELQSWRMKDEEVVCKHPYSFKVVFCDIEIEGREVRQWHQPLFEAMGVAIFGLITRVKGGIREFLIQAKPEVGCFDGVEFGPSVQRECIGDDARTMVDELFDERLRMGKGIRFDTLLSEEGGRFFCEQNRNVILEVGENEMPELPDGFNWVDMKTLQSLLQINNCLNVQLRNLLAVLEW